MARRSVRLPWVVANVLLAVVIGACGGVFATWRMMHFIENAARDLETARTVAWEGEQAVGAYLNAERTIDAKRYALGHYVNVLESHASDPDPWLAIDGDMALAYGRLSRVLDAAGEKDKASRACVKSIAAFQRLGHAFTCDDVLKRIESFDRDLGAAQRQSDRQPDEAHAG